MALFPPLNPLIQDRLSPFEPPIELLKESLPLLWCHVPIIDHWTDGLSGKWPWLPMGSNDTGCLPVSRPRDRGLDSSGSP